MKNKLYLGIGREVITPELGTFLSGYSTSGRDAKSVNDDLTATAFCFQNKDVKAMLISLTITLLDKEISDTIRRYIEKEYGIPYSNIIVHTTHTHSAPLTFTTKGWGVPNTEYVKKILIPRTLAAVKQAVSTMTYVKMSVATGESFVGVNRREMNTKNEIVLGQDKYGVFDSEMTVISFANEDGKCVGNLIHYGCHATAAGSNLEITRDWPGIMIDRLEAVSGGITAFINGTEGDVGPRLTNGCTTGCGDIRYAFEHGGVAAADAVAIYQKSVYHDADLSCISQNIKIPVESRLSYAEAKERLENVSDQNPQHAERIRMFYREILQSYENGYEDVEYVEFEQTAIKLGTVVLISSPFETFSEIGLRIRRAANIPHVLCISMANGCESYFPTKGEIYRGGYETKCFKTERVQPFIDDADSAFVEETLKTLDQF